MVSQPNACERDQELYGSATRVRLTWNGESKFVEFDLDPDPRKKTVFELPKPMMVRSFDLLILARTSGRNGDVAGFAEIELLAP